MKKQLVFILASFPFFLFAQTTEETKEKKNLKLAAVNACVSDYSLSNYPINTTNLIDMNQLIRLDNHFSLDQNNFNMYKWYSDFLDININLSFNPYNKKKDSYSNQREINIGLISISGWRNHINYNNEETKELANGFLGNHFFVIDSINNKNIHLTEYTSELSLYANNIYKTNQENRVSFFGGIGGNIGYSIYNRVSATYRDNSYLNISSNDFINSYSHKELYRSEYVLNAKKSIISRINIPFGVNFKLAKKNTLLKNMSVFLKYTLGLEYQQYIKDKGYLRRYSSTGIGMYYYL